MDWSATVARISRHARHIRPLGLGAAALIAAAVAAASPSREVHKTVPLSPTGHLEISTFKGSVTVTTWDRAEADIHARIEPDGWDSDMQHKIEKTEIRIDSSGGGNSVRVESDYDHVHHLFSFFESNTLPFVHYTIKMPATARLEIEDHKSDTRVSGLKADLKIRTHKGTVKVDGLDGGAEVNTHKGDIEVAFARFSRPSRFKTYKGTVAVRLPKDSKFDLDVDTGRRGDVESDFTVASYRKSRRSGESLRGPVNGGGPELSFESRSGVLKLRGE
jgi:hypothetical protein